ncbi:MAG: membrane protein insertase YidC [Terriglobia bacterium]
MEKRMLIAIVLTLGLLMLWRAFFAPPPPPATRHAEAPAAAAHRAAVSTPKSASVAAPPKQIALPVEHGAAASEITVENSVYRIVFSTQGALVKQWILKQYPDANNKPLDVINADACRAFGYPLSVTLPDAALAAKLNSAIYVATPNAGNISAPGGITFTYSDGKTEVTKQFTFESGYEVKAKVSVFDGTHDLPVSVVWPGGIGDQSLAANMRKKEAKAFYDNGSGIKTVKDKKVGERDSFPGPLAFAGLEDNFFAGVFVPESPESAFDVERQSVTPVGAKVREPEESLEAVLGASQPEPLAFKIFIAPKELDVLRTESPELEKLVNFGWFTIIAKPLFLAMRWVNDHGVHNWGWTIVILTVLINLVFFPLKLKSIRSSQAMQKVAPVVKEIQDRYKQYKFNDPRKQRMNQEVMKVYQEHGVNPMSGCLTMLPQLPIIYAFYEVLETSIAMRHAPWIWWIKDLSVPDPLYILPGLAIVLSFIMQKMTPMPTVDPAQQRMMMVAPLAVGFIFFMEAAGLTLYYFVYCLVAVAQQVLINRMAPPQKAPAQLPPTAVEKSQPPRQRKPAAVKG